MSSRKGLSYHFLRIHRVLDRNKESVVTASILLYAGVYLFAGIGGMSFQFQPATGYITAPSQPSNPDPANNSVINSGPQTVSVSALYSDPDGHSGELTLYELATGSGIGSCSVDDGDRCSASWSTGHGENWWYAVADDDGDGTTTRSENWLFVLNQPPDKTISPDSPSPGSIIYSDSVQLAAQVSDPDGDSLDATFYHNKSFSKTTSPHSSGDVPSVTVSGLSRGETYKWWVDVYDSWNVTKSSEWTFYVNSPPNIYDPTPDDGGFVAEESPEISVKADDDNSGTLTAYFFDNDDNYLAKKSFSGGGEVSTTYSSDTEIGEEYNWKVNVSDGYENRTRVYEFERTTTQRTRIKQGIEYSYSSVILSESGIRDIFFEVENRIDDDKHLITYIEGVNAVFAENNKNLIDYPLKADSKRQFMVQIRPESTGTKYLNITTENQDLGVNTTTSIPVTVKNYNQVSTTSEVSGIGTIQLIMLLLVSAYLYSARL